MLEVKMIKSGYAFSALENRALLLKEVRKVSLCQIGSDAADSEVSRNFDNSAVTSDLILQVKRFPASGGLLGLTYRHQPSGNKSRGRRSDLSRILTFLLRRIDMEEKHLKFVESFIYSNLVAQLSRIHTSIQSGDHDGFIGHLDSTLSSLQATIDKFKEIYDRFKNEKGDEDGKENRV